MQVLDTHLRLAHFMMVVAGRVPQVDRVADAQTSAQESDDQQDASQNVSQPTRHARQRSCYHCIHGTHRSGKHWQSCCMRYRIIAGTSINLLLYLQVCEAPFLVLTSCRTMSACDVKHWYARLIPPALQVKAHVPSKRLLVYDVRSGWAPLCHFLGVPVPETPFPHVNDRGEFQAMIARMRLLNRLAPLCLLSVVVAVVAVVVRSVVRSKAW